ncbi:MAG: hypothetical protein HQL52_12545 [Magnetococcales bacterium]|nr:hypothetical protein [Magnetococcales bacterium]
MDSARGGMEAVLGLEAGYRHLLDSCTNRKEGGWMDSAREGGTGFGLGGL